MLSPIFLGHGSPMNAVESNSFTDAFAKLGQTLPKPKVILCISAHWLTTGTYVTGETSPKQIYDFYGFPETLYKVKYEPPGEPHLAERILALSPNIKLTSEWGLDHGAWAVLCRMYPNQDVPTLQLSLDRTLDVGGHLNLAKKLKPLLSEEVLILSSGNIVHNLRQIDWNPAANPHSWALDFETEALNILADATLSAEQKCQRLFASDNFKLAHPTAEHLLPLVYTIGLSDGPIVTLHRGIQNAAISMAAVIGAH